MTDDEWEQARARAIATAFQTGRPVFADSDGDLKFADDDTSVPADVIQDAVMVTAVEPIRPQGLGWWERVKNTFRRKKT